MGANIVNTMLETLAPHVEKLTGGKTRVCIVSNLTSNRVVHATARWSRGDLGEDTIEKFLDLDAFARVDIYRAVTHNKGIMNGVDAVALATGNDFRALEAGAHGYAALNGYKPLSCYYKDTNGDLVGEITIPLAVGIVGGATKSNPIARVCLSILGVKTAGELAEIIASVGLAQNFAAMRALVSEGIQHGHMSLHAKGIVLSLGVSDRVAQEISQRMIEEKNISYARAQQLLREYREDRENKDAP
jgi:hydroxymethylglutaryl-CoA reductase